MKLFPICVRFGNLGTQFIFIDVVNGSEVVTIKYLMYDKTLTGSYAKTWGLKKLRDSFNLL